MPVLEIAVRKVQLDNDGCLASFEDWDEDLAQALAAREGISALDRDTVTILSFIHDYYRQYDFFPIPNAICKVVNERKDCLKGRFISPLLAWKLAGLPHPEEPIVSLLKAGQSPG